MRGFVRTMVPLAAALAGCSSQPLTGNMTGSGGSVTGAGATGGFAGDATGGTGGAAVSACLALADQYQQVLAVEQTCDVGAAETCATRVDGALSVCGSCETFVTDSSKLDALQRQWEAQNCLALLPKVPCGRLSCGIAFSAVCAPTDGGTRGTCALVYPGGTGGTGGSGGADPATCAALVDKYTAALAIAQSCTGGGTDQCAFDVSPTLLPCRTDCVQFVNDRTDLDAIRAMWDQLGCSKAAGGACPPSVCSGNGPACSATDGGTGTCGSAVLLF